ncbi:MAG: hypothetical protein K0S08_1126 [Gammaproteobacteria bacterium]|jgi:hypothetical protein|nr:hypothetical protein [Gammaproteobacteria bacterium]
MKSFFGMLIMLALNVSVFAQEATPTCGCGNDCPMCQCDDSSGYCWCPSSDGNLSMCALSESNSNPPPVHRHPR